MSSYALIDWLMVSKLNLIVFAIFFCITIAIIIGVLLKPKCKHQYKPMNLCGFDIPAIQICIKCGDVKQ